MEESALRKALRETMGMHASPDSQVLKKSLEGWYSIKPELRELVSTDGKIDPKKMDEFGLTKVPEKIPLMGLAEQVLYLNLSYDETHSVIKYLTETYGFSQELYNKLCWFFDIPKASA